LHLWFDKLTTDKQKPDVRPELVERTLHSPFPRSVQHRIATISDLPSIVEIYNATIPSRMVTADLDAVTVASRVA